MKYFLLPPANEVWGKVIFSQVSVILLTGGSASVHAGIHPPPRRPPCQGNLPCQGDPPLRRPPLQAHSQGGNWGDQIQAHIQGRNWGGSDPGPHPRGKLGNQIQAHTQGGNSRGSDPGPHPRGEIQGDQVQANIQVGNSGGSGPDPPAWQLLLQVVCILLECILIIDVCIVELRWCRWDMAMEQVNGTFALQIEVQTRMHFSRMRTTWFSGCIYRGDLPLGPEGCLLLDPMGSLGPEDVCLFDPHPLHHTPPPRHHTPFTTHPPVDRQTPVKTLPFPKFRLRAVKIENTDHKRTFSEYISSFTDRWGNPYIEHQR